MILNILLAALAGVLVLVGVVSAATRHKSPIPSLFFSIPYSSPYMQNRRFRKEAAVLHLFI